MASILPPFLTSGSDHSASHGIVATARLMATSKDSRSVGSWAADSARSARTAMSVSPSDLIACSRNAAFLRVDSIISTNASGADDRQRDGGNAAAGAEVGDADFARRQMRQAA